MTKVQVSPTSEYSLAGQPNLNIKIDREKARAMASIPATSTPWSSGARGTTATTVLEGDRQFNLPSGSIPNTAAALTPSAPSRSPIRRRGHQWLRSLSELANITLDTVLRSSIANAASVSFRSSSVFAAAISAVRSRKPRARHESRQASEWLPDHLGRRVRNLQNAKQRLLVVVRSRCS